MTEPKRILKWEYASAEDQELYLERARYLIDHGYQTLDARHIDTLARRIYHADKEEDDE